MLEQSSAIISKVWGMCSTLRDDGVGYGDYLEQLTYLIFLKMSDEYSKPPYKKDTSHEQNSTSSVFMRGCEAWQTSLSLWIYRNNQLRMV